MVENVSNPLTMQILNVLQQYCCFPKQILETHCKKINKTPEMLNAADLPELAPRLGQAVERFTTPEKGQKTTEALLQLR